MSFPDKFLDDLRAAVRVSSVVGRKFHLRKQGSELVAVEDKSVTVSDKKCLWYDFGAAKEGGDVFKFLEVYEGMSFVDAVKEIAGIANIALPETGDRKFARPNGNGSDHPSAGEDARPRANGAQAGSSQRAITKTYDYVDAQGALIYQVCRMEWVEKGKPCKTFFQRRPSPEGDKAWVNSLSFLAEDGESIEFMRKGPGANWSRFDADNYEQWHFTQRRNFATAGNVVHSLYRLPDLLADMAEERNDQRTWLLAEGEKDVETLVAWGCAATTNSGGAGNFTSAIAAHFTDAADVVLLEDNDDAGRKRTNDIAPLLLGVGARVRALRISDHWPSAPKGADVTDWRDKANGDSDKLFSIIDKLEDWRPPPFESKYGLKTWRDLDRAPAPYLWTVKGLVPKTENVLIIGPSRSGKTFETLDLAMHVVRGLNFVGRKTTRGGIVYCCYEGAAGFERRLRAYMKHHNFKLDDSVPFAWLTRPPGIYAAEENAKQLAEDIAAGTEHWSIAPAAIIVDTHNSATRGSSEIKSDDMGKIQDRYDLISQRLHAPLWIVGHTNKEGAHRGNEQLFNRIETQLLVERTTEGSGKTVAERTDDQGRVIRRLRVDKQREGEDKIGWDFVLQKVVLGIDEDGDEITSMVSVEPARPPEEREAQQESASGRVSDAEPGTWHLNKGEATFFRAMMRALAEKGLKPLPAMEPYPGSSVGLVVAWSAVTEVYRSMVPNDDDTPEGRLKYRNRIKSAMHRARDDLARRNVLGVGEVRSEDVERASAHYVWPAGRPVRGEGVVWSPPGARSTRRYEPEAQPTDEATGEPITDLDGLKGVF